jgi:hypothetical protein
MNWILTSIHTHPTWWTLGAYYLFSNAVSSMPMPDATSGKFYGWLFKFFNGLAANVSRAWAGKIPVGDAIPK